MAGTIINFLVDLTNVIMLSAIAIMIFYAFYLLYLRKKRNDQLAMHEDNNLVKRLVSFAVKLGKKIKER